jgi:hypothetical protein
LTWPTGLCRFKNSLENSDIQNFPFKDQKWLDLSKRIKDFDEK